MIKELTEFYRQHGKIIPMDQEEAGKLIEEIEKLMGNSTAKYKMLPEVKGGTGCNGCPAQHTEGADKCQELNAESGINCNEAHIIYVQA